jgi:DNA-directed RNA polymerase subunit RPC12/RpoP
MSRTWYYCQTCQTTHPETSPGTGLLVCPYCSGTAVTLVPRSDLAASLRNGTRRPSQLKATCADRTSGGDQSTQADIHLTGERPIVRPLTKT